MLEFTGRRGKIRLVCDGLESISSVEEGSESYIQQSIRAIIRTVSGDELFVKETPEEVLEIWRKGG